MVPASARGYNLFKILAPAEGRGALAVVGLQIRVHGIHQTLQGGEVAALQTAPRQFGEETLHRLHPGTGGGYEVKVPVGVRVQPGMHIGGLIPGVGVQDHRHGGVGFTRVFPRWESVKASGSVGPPRVWPYHTPPGATVSGSVRAERPRGGRSAGVGGRVVRRTEAAGVWRERWRSAMRVGSGGARVRPAQAAQAAAR